MHLSVACAKPSINAAQPLQCHQLPQTHHLLPWGRNKPVSQGYVTLQKTHFGLHKNVTLWLLVAFNCYLMIAILHMGLHCGRLGDCKTLIEFAYHYFLSMQANLGRKIFQFMQHSHYVGTNQLY